MYKITLSFLLILLPWLFYGQCNTPLPEGEVAQKFCPTTLLAQIGAPPAQLDDLEVYGKNLQWYADAAGTSPLPVSTQPTNNTTYYVGQTKNGCQGPLLAVSLTTKDCNCVPNGGFEKDPTNTYGFSRYDSYQNGGGYPTGIQSCQTDTGNLPLTAIAPVLSYGYGLGIDAVNTTIGNDPALIPSGISMPRVNPDNPRSTRAIRLNDNSANGTITRMEKKIIAGRSFSFSMALVFEHVVYQASFQPFFRVRAYDVQGNLIDEKCIVADPDNCIFNEDPYPAFPSTLQYTGWSCMTLDTRSIVGQPATIEFVVSDFRGAGSEFGYVYLDDLGKEPCRDSKFGGVALDPVVPAPPSGCSLLPPPLDDPCGPGLPTKVASLPVQVCGTYSPTPGGYLNGVLLEVFQNGQYVGSTTNASLQGSGFCATLKASDLSVPPYGEFEFAVSTEFKCANGFPSEAHTSSAGIKICPEAGCPGDLLACTTGGSATFDLTTQDTAIKGTMDLATVTVSYYESLADATSGTAALPNPTAYVPTGATQVIYASLSYDYTALGIAPVADCYDVVSFTLTTGKVPPVPQTLTSYGQCDDGNTRYTFDLTGKETELFAGLDPTDYTWAFYTSMASAQTGDPATAIQDPVNYSSSGGQTIYIRTQSSEGCFSITSFDLTVNSLPSYNPPATLSTCDDAILDGTAPFTLATATSQITGNDPDLSVSYYEQQADAEAGANNALPDPYTNTTPYNQTIYVRIESSSTGCSTTDLLDLVVKQAPAAITPAVYVVCDPDNDGTADFDLSSLDNEITAGAAGVSVSYHATRANAENNVLPLPTNFTNTVNTAQTIYARVSSPGVDCYNIVEVALEVTDSPQPVLPSDLSALSACDSDGNGSEVFDLTQMRGDILANETDPSDFELSYYANPNDLANDNPISVPAAYTNTGSPQTIYVVVEGNNSCTKGTSFEITVNPLPVIYPPFGIRTL